MRDREHIDRPQSTWVPTPAVDEDSVGAAQVAHQHFAVNLDQAAVPPRGTDRREPSVAVRMAADHHERPIQGDVGLSGQGDKTSGQGRSPEATDNGREDDQRQGLARRNARASDSQSAGQDGHVLIRSTEGLTDEARATALARALEVENS
jgi:hypothetical protein